jgi:hypothetical protein
VLSDCHLLSRINIPGWDFADTSKMQKTRFRLLSSYKPLMEDGDVASDAVPSMGGVEWRKGSLHSTPYQLEWSGVE